MKITSKISIASIILFLAALLTSCGSGFPADQSVDYQPLDTGEFQISTPTQEGLDPEQLARLYRDAGKLRSIYSLLIFKNGKLVAENYFNEGSVSLRSNIQSATKSYISALVGIALEQGCITSIDQPFLDYFPEYTDLIQDPRKKEITIRHLLQMRAGYPWEESDPDFWNVFVAGDFLGLMVPVPLISDPGTEFHYSNLSSHYLGVIVERACGIGLRTYTENNLFTPLGAELGDWYTTASDDRYPMGCGSMHVSARDLAKFGMLYMNEGVFNGERVLPPEWIAESFDIYSQDPDSGVKVGRNFNKVGYGYQWWTIRAGDHFYKMAYGHGGQQVILLEDLDMLIVSTADPHFLEHNDRAWRDEKANLNLVADFIASLKTER